MFGFWKKKENRSGIKEEQIDDLIDNPVKARLAAKSKNISMMIVNMNDYSVMAGNMSPQEVVELMNRYFTLVSDSIEQHLGTVDALHGDRLTAFWNAPGEVNKHAQQACLAAVDIRMKVGEWAAQLKVDRDLDFTIRISVHSGEAVVGNMGSERMLNYTMMGENVNILKDLDVRCKEQGLSIAITEETKRDCGILDAAAHPAFEFHYGEKKRQINVFSLE